MPLSPEDLRNLSLLLDEALSLAPHQVEDWCARLPTAQQHLAPTLRRLLAKRHDEEGAPRNSAAAPVWSGTLPTLSDASNEGSVGDQIGPYRLREWLGRGGMGSVWCADRVDGLFEREVAIKLPRLGKSADLAQRMARERQIWARLEHPHIARLYDAGIDDRARPYIVMERIHGHSLVEHAARHHLDRDARLGLALQICAGLAHAHRHLVVHRDIKPSNLLVDQDGVVKLLDFGIARLLEEGTDLVSRTTPGDSSQRTHSPRYAAPEQRLGGPEGQPITTRTDIYALGIVLHELVTDDLPDPPYGAASHPLLDLDLAAVIARATQPHPDERYGSVELLAQDLQSLLDHRPVTARRPSPWQRMQLFVRRHRVAVASCLVATLLLGALGLYAHGQRELAAAQLRRMADAQRFLFDMLEDVEPLAGQTSADITGRQMLAAATTRARASFAGDLALRGQVLVELGLLQRRLHQPDEALALITEGHGLLEQHAPVGDAGRAIGSAQRALQHLENHGSSGDTFARALATQALRCTGEEAACARARAYAEAALMNAAALRGDGDQAVVHGRRAVSATDQAFGADDAEAAMARLHLAIVLRSSGRMNEAQLLVRQAQGIADRTDMREGDLVQMRLYLASIEAGLGNDAQAIQILRALAGRPGAAHAAGAMARLIAQSAFRLGLGKVALQEGQKALEHARKDEDFVEMVWSGQVLARALAADGQTEHAQEAAVAAMSDGERAGLASNPTERVNSRRTEAELAAQAGQVEAAHKLMQDLLGDRSSFKADVIAPVELAQALDLAGALDRCQGSTTRAIQRHEEAASALAAALPADHPQRLRNQFYRTLASHPTTPGVLSPAPALNQAADAYLKPLPPESLWRTRVAALLANSKDCRLILP